MVDDKGKLKEEMQSSIVAKRFYLLPWEDYKINIERARK